MALADLNGDGLMDVLFTGNSRSSTPFVPEGGVAINRSTGERTEGSVPFNIVNLPTRTVLGSASWSDYDLDGDLDFLITGSTSSEAPFESVSLLFNNSGGEFTPVDAGFTGVHSSIVRWADVDNDGDEDLFLAGFTTDGSAIAIIYRNDRDAGFGQFDTPVFQAAFGDAAWGDYDNDGDLDLVVSGTDEKGSFKTVLYRNDGFGGFTDSGENIQGFAFSSIEWGDYDGDGDLDLITSGAQLAVEDIFHGKTILYRNDGGSLTRLDDEFGGVFYGDVTWGDYDLDGSLDLFVMGRASLDGRHIGRMYRNDAGHLIEATGLVGTSTANAEWIDFDGDNDLDIFVVGRNLGAVPFSKLYRNDSRLVNRTPIPPTGLSTSINADVATLSWGPGDDLETAATALSYSVRVGTSPGSSDIFTADANSETGKRWLFGPGNVGQNLSWTLRDLPIGLYFWSVQTIDNSYIGSTFSEEGQFSILTSGKVSTATTSGADLPEKIRLHPAYPNPTFTTTTFVYDIPKATPVEITVFDAIGKRIKTLVNAFSTGGTHRVSWNGDTASGNKVGAGVYFVRMRAGEHVFSQKIVILN